METDWITISGGSYHTSALKDNGSIYLWGWNAEGQLGNGTLENSLVPININSCTLSVDEQHMVTFTIFPNPTDSYINISSARDTTMLSMKIYDANGKLLLEQNDQFRTVDISEFQKGIYFLNIVTDYGTATHKIIRK